MNCEKEVFSQFFYFSVGNQKFLNLYRKKEATDMSLIAVSNLTFGYDGSSDFIFEEVSFQIDTNWKLGFIGRNGRGKTTFLKLLMGKLEYQGKIHAAVEFDYFPFEMKDKTKTVWEMAQEICPDAEQWKFCRELSLLETKEEILNRSFETLSNGEQTKAALAILFLRENQFLLIDEPTNHLDRRAREIVGKYLKGKRGFILVSHDRAFLDSCVDHILSINKTNIEIQKGNFTSWMENKEKNDQFELAENDRLKKEIKKLNIAARRTMGWSEKVEKSKFGEKVPDRGFIGHKAAKMMKRAKNIEARQSQAMEKKQALLKNLETAETLKIKTLIYPKKQLIELKQVSVDYGEGALFPSVSFTVEQGDRIAFVGKNGSGKSSLIKLLMGENISYQGELKRGSNLVFSYVSQDTSFLKGGLREYIQEKRLEESLFKAILRKLDFSRTQFEKKLEDFSEGQKKKVLIAASLCQPAHLYFWDEPLNFIDVLSRIQIESLILEYKPTMILVEHDKTLIDNAATKKIFLG